MLPPRVYKPYKPLNTGCALCKSNQNLSRCAGCHISLYCSREHQLTHRASHKRACNAIKKATSKLASEETKLRNAPPDSFMPANVFETCVGHFWGIMETRDYMRARYGLIEAIMELNYERKAMENALGHLMDMLRLCRSDNMGLRDMVPHLMLRLDRDQEAYDFIKWWETVREGDYDWGDMDLPFLDTKDADVWEGVELYCGEFRSLSSMVAVTFLKMKMLIDLRALIGAAAIGKKLPEELVLGIQKEIPRSPVVKELLTKPDRDFRALEEKLVAQIKELAPAVRKANKYVWSAIEQPRDLDANPDFVQHGSVQEMQLIVKYCHDCWAETPGAIDLMTTIAMGQYE